MDNSGEGILRAKSLKELDQKLRKLEEKRRKVVEQARARLSR